MQRARCLRNSRCAGGGGQRKKGYFELPRLALWHNYINIARPRADTLNRPWRFLRPLSSRGRLRPEIREPMHAEIVATLRLSVWFRGIWWCSGLFLRVGWWWHWVLSVSGICIFLVVHWGVDSYKWFVWNLIFGIEISLINATTKLLANQLVWIYWMTLDSWLEILWVEKGRKWPDRIKPLNEAITYNLFEYIQLVKKSFDESDDCKLYLELLSSLWRDRLSRERAGVETSCASRHLFTPIRLEVHTALHSQRGCCTVPIKIFHFFKRTEFSFKTLILIYSLIPIWFLWIKELPVSLLDKFI